MDFLPYLTFMLLVVLAVAATTFGITAWVYVQGNKDEDDTAPAKRQGRSGTEALAGARSHR